MSRFYEVLKQAGRSLHLGDEAQAEAISSSLAFNEIEEAMQPAAASQSLFEAIEESQLIAPKEALPRNGSLGIDTEASISEKAHLIPHAMEQGVVEQYRLLRTKIMQKRTEKMFHSLLITSAGPREGKTVTILNLAWAFSMIPSFRVLTVDGDIRLGQMSKWLGVDEHPGFSDLLEGSRSLKDVVLKSAGIPFCFM